MSKVIRVIGIGENGAAGLSQETLEHIERADLLVGGERQLGFFKAAAGEKRTLKSGLSAVVEELGRLREHKDIVVLASGDPLFLELQVICLPSWGRNIWILCRILARFSWRLRVSVKAGRMRCWKAYTVAR